MMTKTMKKSLLGILVACLLSLAVVFTATGALSARAADGDYDENGWTQKIATGAWQEGINEYKNADEIGGESYSHIVTYNNSSLYNSTEIDLSNDKPGIKLSYKLPSLEKPIVLYLISDSAYHDTTSKAHAGSHCNDITSTEGRIGFQLNGTSIMSEKFGFSGSKSWTGLDPNKCYDINIYIGTGVNDDKSYVIINNKKEESTVTLEDFKTSIDNQDKYRAHWAIHSGTGRGGVETEIWLSKPMNIDKPELPPYAVTGLAENIKMGVGDEKTFTCAPNEDLAVVENLKYRWESSASDVVAVDPTGKVNVLKAGNAVIKVVAYTGEGADVQEYAEAACTVYAFPYDSESGWLTSVGDGWNGFGIAQDTFTNNDDGTVSFTVNGSTETWNGSPVDPSAGLIHFTYTVGENTDTAKVGMVFHLINQTAFDSNLRTADVFPSRIDHDRPGPFGFYASNEVVNFQTNKGNVAWEGITDSADDENKFLNIKAGDKVDVAIYVGSGEENDKSYIVINGNKRISKAKLSDYGNATDGYKAYLHLFSTNAARAITISKPETVKNVVFLDNYAKSVEVGDEFTLTGSVASVEAQAPAITWASSDPTVAKVENGKVTALKKGNAVITATVGTGDDAYTAECAVEITDILLTGVTLDKTQITLKVGEKTTITATYAPANATCNHDFKWRVQRSAVAAIEGDDNVATITIEALTVGTTRVTVTCGEGADAKTANCDITVTKADEPVNPDPGDKDPENPGDNTDPGDNTNPGDAEPSGDNGGKKKGCGSSVAGGGALAMAILSLATCAVILSKKRKADDK